ncbi:unnamed protein product [Mycena citricolor]|uniref:Uncharacterized protein n=2 Tax=Mycena citricolor TaxID=2018698 RepID=A0AAD2H4P7_9AGAR|nr:unnamed protein product [Mycena citricolor]
MAISPAQKAAVEEVLNAITSATGPPRKRQLASMFMDLVDREDWAEYYEVIPEPRCLRDIAASLEKNRYKDALTVYTDLSLVFLNALFYNEPDSQIAADAQKLKALLESEWKAKSPLLPQPSTPVAPQTRAAPPVSHVLSGLKPSPGAPAPTAATLSHTTDIEMSAAISAAPASSAPVSQDPESESESEEDEIHELWTVPPDIEIVHQLELGIPQYELLVGEDGGWMADVKHERHLEIVQAVKAYRDAAGVKLSTALDGVPDDKNPITFRLLDSRSRSKTFYTSSHAFDADLARMFESGRRYYLDRAGVITGAKGEEWERVIALQRVANALTSSEPPPLPPVQPLSCPPAHYGPDAVECDTVNHKGYALQAGQYVHIVAGQDHQNNMQIGVLGRSGGPLVGRITKCWRNSVGNEGVSVQWYLRADQISSALLPNRQRGGAEGEVVETDQTTHHLLADVIERVTCQHVSTAGRGRLRAPFWYPGWPVYVCGYRYDAVQGRLRHISPSTWRARNTPGGFIEDMYLFERPLRLGKRDEKPSASTSDRSVVTAGGAAVSTVEKLSTETTRHFERDPLSGEMFWFPGPPLPMTKPQAPRHRLEYLHFLAKKCDSEKGALENEDGRAAKRTRLSASERLEEALQVIQGEE